MRIAVAIQTPEVTRPVPVCLFSGTFEERLVKAAAAGAEGVELMPVDPEQIDAAVLRAVIADAGLEVVAIGTGAVPFATGLTLLAAERNIAQAARERLRTLLDLADALGAPVLTIGSFRGWSGGDAHARERLADILKSEVAGRHTTVAVEMLNRYESDLLNTCAEGVDFVMNAGAGRLGLLLDTYHMNIEEPSLPEALRSAVEAGVLRHVHIGDSNRFPPGRGHIDFRELIRTLRESGYTGWLSAELLGKPDPDTAGRESIAYLHRLRAESP